MCEYFILFLRLAKLISNVNATYQQSDITKAVLEVIDTYTFFDDAYDKVNEWSGKQGELQRIIVNNYTDIIPTVMREVTSCFMENIHYNLFTSKEQLR